MTKREKEMVATLKKLKDDTIFIRSVAKREKDKVYFEGIVEGYNRAIDLIEGNEWD